MDFNLVCNKCKQNIEGDPFEHVKKCYKPLELFTLVPKLSWKDFAAKEPKDAEGYEEEEEPSNVKKVVEQYTGIKLKPKKKPTEEEEDEE